MLQATSAPRGPGAPKAPRVAREALDAAARSWHISIDSPTEIPEGPDLSTIVGCRGELSLVLVSADETVGNPSRPIAATALPSAIFRRLSMSRRGFENATMKSRFMWSPYGRDKIVERYCWGCKSFVSS